MVLRFARQVVAGEYRSVPAALPGCREALAGLGLGVRHTAHSTTARLHALAHKLGWAAGFRRWTPPENEVADRFARAVLRGKYPRATAATADCARALRQAGLGGRSLAEVRRKLICQTLRLDEPQRIRTGAGRRSAFWTASPERWPVTAIRRSRPPRRRAGWLCVMPGCRGGRNTAFAAGCANRRSPSDDSGATGSGLRASFAVWPGLPATTLPVCIRTSGARLLPGCVRWAGPVQKDAGLGRECNVSFLTARTTSGGRSDGGIGRKPRTGCATRGCAGTNDTVQCGAIVRPGRPPPGSMRNSRMPATSGRSTPAARTSTRGACASWALPSLTRMARDTSHIPARHQGAA